MKLSIQLIKYLALVSFIVMVATNALATILPIGGVTTADVADSYFNLFAPAGITFAIWGVIYFALAIYVLYQFRKNKTTKNSNEIFKSIGPYFIASSILNTIWILAWHYNFIFLSLLLILMILFCLTKIAIIIDGFKLSKIDSMIIGLPFSIYFGWITVAVIANITIFLVSIYWGGFGLSEVMLTVITLLAGLIIGLAMIFRFKKLSYGFVLIWAYFGIWLKHTSESGFNNNYPEVIVAALISIIVFATANAYILFKKNKFIKQA